MTTDISIFYLNTPMDRYEPLKIKLSDTPAKIMRLYKLKEKGTTYGSVYTDTRKGMYGLPQAGLNAKKLLEKQLAKTNIPKAS